MSDQQRALPHACPRRFACYLIPVSPQVVGRRSCGKEIPIFTGTQQLHVTSGVAHGAWQYWEATRDRDFIARGAHRDSRRDCPHNARAPLTMEGGTTFRFVTDGIEAALKRAKEAAQGKDVRLGGGVATIRQYLTAGLIDEIHLAISPVLLGRGEHLLADIDTIRLGYKCTEHVSTDHATHVVLTK